MKKEIKTKSNRKIRLEFDEDYNDNTYYINIYACDISDDDLDSDNIIGTFQYKRVDQYEDDYGCNEGSLLLSHMQIDSGYQGEGIGTEIIRFGEECLPLRVVYINAFAAKSAHNNDYYADEGLSLMNHCIKLGIISKQKIYGNNEIDDDIEYYEAMAEEYFNDKDKD